VTAFPQYAATNNADVIAAIERNAEGRAAFHQIGVDFAKAQGVQDGAFFLNGFGGRYRVAAVGGATKPTTGRWTDGYRGGWRPFKNNPLFAEMTKIKFDAESIPGLPDTVDGPTNRDLSHLVGTPHPFIVDGFAYVGFTFQPVEPAGPAPDPADGGWEEIKASEYHHARETYNERISK
jgi:hypothetical protein